MKRDKMELQRQLLTEQLAKLDPEAQVKLLNLLKEKNSLYKEVLEGFMNR